MPHNWSTKDVPAEATELNTAARWLRGGRALANCKHLDISAKSGK